MPFHSKFNLEVLTPKNGNVNYVKFSDIRKIDNTKFSILENSLPNDQKEDLRFAQQLSRRREYDTTFGEFIPGASARAIFENLNPVVGESTIFKVIKQDLVELLNQIPNAEKKDFRFVVNFGSTNSNTGLTLFLTAMTVKGVAPSKVLGKYIECVDINSIASTEMKDIDNKFNTKTSKYQSDRLNSYDSTEKGKRKGISHFVSSIYSNVGGQQILEEVGIEDYIKTIPNDTDPIYLHLGRGDVKLGRRAYSQSKDYLTVVFSRYSSITDYSTVTAESNVFYDKSGTCCPPQY